MGEVVPFKRKVTGSEKGGRRKPAKVYVGLNVYIDPVEDELDCRADRNALHGVLSAYGFTLTRGLFKKLFELGGVHRVTCDEAVARLVRAAIARRLPELEVRMVKRAA